MTKPVGCHHSAANWVISRKVQQSSGKSVRNCFALGWRRKCLDGVYHDYTDCEFLVVNPLRKFSIPVILIWSLNETDLRIPSAFATRVFENYFWFFGSKRGHTFAEACLKRLPVSWAAAGIVPFVFHIVFEPERSQGTNCFLKPTFQKNISDFHSCARMSSNREISSFHS